MGRSDIEAKMAKESGITRQQAETALDSFIASIVDNLKSGQKVTLVGFGTFSLVQVSARMGRNPKTGEAISLPAYKKPKFSASKALKDLLNT